MTWRYSNTDNQLHTLGSSKDGGNAFLILGVVLIVVWFLLSAMFAYYMYQFKKTKSDTKLYGKGMLISNFVLSFLQMVFGVLELVFWGVGKQIFNYGNLLTNGATANYNALVAFAVIGFVALAAAIVMMWFFLPYYGIAFDGRRILFMGEDIPYQSITKIVIDSETRSTYVNYTRGKRAHKRLKFSASSAFGLFIQKNSSLTGHPAEEADEKSYYKSLMESDRIAEKKFDKEVNNKIKNKDARTTSSKSKDDSKSENK